MNSLVRITWGRGKEEGGDDGELTAKEKGKRAALGKKEKGPELGTTVVGKKKRGKRINKKIKEGGDFSITISATCRRKKKGGRKSVRRDVLIEKKKKRGEDGSKEKGGGVGGGGGGGGGS